MANHYNGKYCFFELDEQGNLTIHRDGRHLIVPEVDAVSLLHWLNKKQEDAALDILKRLLPSRLVADVRDCRGCGSPVLHMDHLTRQQARELETKTHALLGHTEWDEEGV